MRYERDLDRLVPDAETWDLPRRLNPDDCRSEVGGVDRDPPRFQEEDER